MPLSPSSRNNRLFVSLLLCGFLLFSLQAGAAQESGQNVTAYAQGVQAYRAGDYQQAVQRFRQVLSEEAGNVNAHYYLGLSLDFLKQTAEAVPEYQYVLAHGQEPKILEYARNRLNVLTAGNSATQPGIAMIAASNPVAPVVYRGSASRVAVPLKNSRNALMVDATLRNQNARTGGTFIIDTGATYTSISQEMAEQLGLDLAHCDTVRITTANGRIDVPKVTIGTLNVNGLEAHNVEATVIPVRPGSSFSGLIGLSFIKQFVLTIDPQGGQLIFQKN